MHNDDHTNHITLNDLENGSELERRFVRYMERTIINAKLDYLDRLHRMEKHEVLTDGQEFDDLVAVDDLPDESLSEVFLDPQLSEAVGRLPHVQRQILELAVIQGYSHREVAKKLGCSQPLVTQQLHKALQSLREAMEDDPV